MIVYLITNLINNKKYVGQTINSLERRWKRHIWDAKKNAPYALHRAMHKYGVESFTIVTLFTCNKKTTLDLYERGHIKFFGTRYSDKGYNMTDGGEGVIGHVATEEQRQKGRERMQGKSLPEYWCRAISKGLLGKPSKLKGKPLSPEHAAKITALNRLRNVTPEQRAISRETAKNKVWSPEAREKISKARKAYRAHIGPYLPHRKFLSYQGQRQHLTSYKARGLTITCGTILK